ncbi:MAG: hypothetical protein ACYC6C_12425 [Coriobacteriia bacterium]
MPSTTRIISSRLVSNLSTQLSFVNEIDAWHTARIDHDGKVLDPEGVPIAENKSFKQNIALSFDGTQSH